MTATIPYIHNEESILLKDIPSLDEDAFSETLADFLNRGYRICTYFGDYSDSDKTHLYAVAADDRSGLLYIISGLIRSGYFPSLAESFPQISLFEREIHEQTGLIPDGHPWLKPVRFSIKNQSNKETPPAIGQMDYFRILGDEIHEVAVGPVHAGIIEPGHFRFQCHGETVYHLEISLGYQHRGIEEAMRGGPFSVTPFQMETIAGDTSIGHMTAYCQIIESLAKQNISPDASLMRAVALELERCANHTGDLGALAGDIGFLPTMSYCGRIRGDFLNITALICGNRFGRGIAIPGGVGYAVDEKRKSELSTRLGSGLKDFLDATKLLWEESSVADRFESTGKLSKAVAKEIGLVGVAARACGNIVDVRQDHAHGYYRFAHIPVSTHDTGDVFARAHVRWREVQSSAEFLLQHIGHLGSSSHSGNGKGPSPLSMQLNANALAVSLVEGWRGEICHAAVTDENGRFRRYKIVDPSFHNWFGLALALRNEAISDFPLCNKSFNLSYCGFDL